MIFEFDKPERICIVNNNGTIVRLNNSLRTELRFDASYRAKARKLLDRLNASHAKGAIKGGPFRLIPLIGEERDTALMLERMREMCDA